MEILYVDPNGELKALIFDATLRESPTYSATMFKHKVERGADLTDHVKQEADTLSVEAFVSNHPIKANVGGYTGLGGGELGGVVESLDLGPVTGRRYSKGATVGKTPKDIRSATYETEQSQGTAQVLQFPAPFDRVQAVHDILLDIKRRAVEVAVSIGLNTWDTMLVIKLSPPQDSKTGSGISFTIDLEEVRYATSETVDTPEPFETRAEREQRLGEQVEVTPTPDDRSTARRMLDGLADAGFLQRGVFGTGD